MTSADLEQIDLRLIEDYKKVLTECKRIETYLREREKDLLNIEGFGMGGLYTGKEANDTPDGGVRLDLAKVISVDESTSDTLSDTAGAEIIGEESGSEGAVCSHEDKTEWQRSTIFSSLIETKDNLREIVDSASKRGAEAWKKLVKKSEKRRQRTESEPASVCSDAMSFDLEIECNTCGKKIIESRQRVLDGQTLTDTSMDSIECLVCSEGGQGSGADPDQWTLRYPKVFKQRERSKTETNPETGERGVDSVDAPLFFVINGEDVDDRKTAAGAIETMYEVSGKCFLCLLRYHCKNYVQKLQNLPSEILTIYHIS